MLRYSQDPAKTRFLQMKDCCACFKYNFAMGKDRMECQTNFKRGRGSQAYLFFRRNMTLLIRRLTLTCEFMQTTVVPQNSKSVRDNAAWYYW